MSHASGGKLTLISGVLRDKVRIRRRKTTLWISALARDANGVDYVFSSSDRVCLEHVDRRDISPSEPLRWSGSFKFREVEVICARRLLLIESPRSSCSPRLPAAVPAVFTAPGDQ